jgi:hypothetical protein
MSDQPSPERIIQVGLGFWAAKTLLSAVELGLFTELAKQPLELRALERRLGLHERSARDFLDALVSLGFLRRADGKYHNAPETEIFLDRAKPSYVGGLLEMANRRLYPFWGHLTEALRTGKPQNEAKGGQDFFADIYADPQRLKGFLEAMTGVSHGANVAVARQFPWSDYKRFADLGAAQGGLALQIALHNPHIKGVGFDLPVVEPIFEEFIAKGGVASRVTFQGGDFFKDALPEADVFLMGHILHDWNLEDKRRLIQKVFEALPAGGGFIVYDAIIDDDRSQNAFGLMMSLNMLIETPGGFDYTGADCMGWMKAAGFRETRIEHLVGPDSMVIGIK